MSAQTSTVTGSDLVQAGALPVMGYAASALADANLIASTIIAITGAIMGLHAVTALAYRYLQKSRGL